MTTTNATTETVASTTEAVLQEEVPQEEKTSRAKHEKGSKAPRTAKVTPVKKEKAKKEEKPESSKTRAKHEAVSAPTPTPSRRVAEEHGGYATSLDMSSVRIEESTGRIFADIKRFVLPEYDGRVRPAVITDDWVEDIKARKVKTPLDVYVLADGMLEINAGRRRYGGAIRAELTELPINVLPSPDTLYEARLEAFRENFKREGTTPADVMDFIEGQMAEPLPDGSARRAADLARDIGVSPAYISQNRAIAKLPEDVLALYRAGEFEPGTFAKGKKLATLNNLRDTAGADRITEVQKILAQVARIMKPEGFATLVDAVKTAMEELKAIDPRVIDLAASGGLEPDTWSKLEVLNRIKNGDQQSRLATLASDKDADVDSLKESVKKVTSPKDPETPDAAPEGPKYDNHPVKVATPAKLANLLDGARTRAEELGRLKEPTTAQASRKAFFEGQITAFRKAMGLPIKESD